jgi:hypothetical protein
MSGHEAEDSNPEDPRAVSSVELDREVETRRRKWSEKAAHIFCVASNWLLEFAKPANVVAILLFLATLALYCATRDLVKDAQRTSATAEANGKRQLRAYVLYNGGKINPGNAKDTFQVEIEIKNGGVTPAYNVTRSCAKTVLPVGLKRPKPQMFPFEETSVDTLDMLPGAVMPISECRSIAFTKTEMTSPTAAYVLGVVKYRDLFQRCQEELFIAKGVPKGAGWDLETIWQSASDPESPCDDGGDYRKSVNPLWLKPAKD